MKRFVLRYLIFWLPAAAVAWFFQNGGRASLVLGWFFGFFLLLGWTINTAAAAYHYPRATLSLLLAYAGFHTLMLSAVFTADFRSGLYIVLRALSGVFTFQPLWALTQALGDLTWNSELWTVAVVTGCCLLGYLAGLVRRRVHPNPYRPRFTRNP